jgi:protein TonB
LQIVSVPGGLIRAFAISIACHVLLLWPAAIVWQESVPSTPMVASLRPSAAPVAPALPVAVRPSTNPIPAKPRSIAAEQAETRTIDTSSSTASPVTGSEAPAALPVAEARPAVASALPPSAGTDAEGLRAYRVALAGEARRHKRYPPRAIEAGWSGTTELRVSMAPGQAVPVVQVSKASGYPVLDEAALEMMRRALAATPIPASLRERTFSVDLPIVFDLPQ